jgi:hypothetical protein
MRASKTPRIQRIGNGIISAMLAIGVTTLFGAKSGRPSLAAILVFFVAAWGLFYMLWGWVFVTRPREVKKNVPITSKEWRRRQKQFYDNLPRL